jgi:hypothetical protein
MCAAGARSRRALLPQRASRARCSSVHDPRCEIAEACVLFCKPSAAQRSTAFIGRQFGLTELQNQNCVRGNRSLRVG